jgi:hypothetical protein
LKSIVRQEIGLLMNLLTKCLLCDESTEESSLCVSCKQEQIIEIMARITLNE